MNGIIIPWKGYVYEVLPLVAALVYSLSLFMPLFNRKLEKYLRIGEYQMVLHFLYYTSLAFLWLVAWYWYIALPLCWILLIIMNILLRKEMISGETQENEGGFGLSKRTIKLNKIAFSSLNEDERIVFMNQWTSGRIRASRKVFLICGFIYPILVLIIFSLSNIGYLF